MASREHDRAAGEMLRRSLADASRAEGAESCPATDVLAAYYERALDAAETAHCDLHFSQCARCREQLAALARADESAAARDETPQPRAGGAWLWNWRWLAPAAAVLAIAIVWVARRPAATHTAKEASPPLLAVSRPLEPPMSPAEQKSLPESRVSVFGQSSGAAPAARTASDSTLDRERSATLGRLSAPAPGKKAAENLPMSGRNYAEMDALAKADAAPSRAAANEVAADAAKPKVSAGVPQPASASASVAPPAVGEAVEKVVVSSQQAVVETQASAGALRARQVESPGRRDAKQAAIPAIVGGYAARSEATAVLSTDEGSAETLIRTPDGSVLWRLSPGGFVERSLDAGATWQGQTLNNVEARLVAGSAPAAKICWLVGRNGIILLTQDGATWKTVPPPIQADFVNVAARDASSATVTASDRRTFSTSDRGEHWNALP